MRTSRCVPFRSGPCQHRLGGWHAQRPQNSRPQAVTRAAREGVQANRGLHAERDRLEAELAACVKREDFARAAALSKELKQLDEQSPLMRVQRELKKAIADERYQDAARLQKELLALQSDPSTPVDLDAVATTSDAVTRGVRVRVRSFYLPTHSQPGNNQYMFAYNITISNESDQIVQLKNRHWIITDQNGNKEEVRGPGVVGQQPVLLPGKKFSYNSGCPLPTECGTMEGTYEFMVLDEKDGLFKEPFSVTIARFKLTTQGEAIA